MEKTWSCVIIASIIWGLLSGKAEEAAASFVQGGTDALTLSFTLAATMGVWSGLMEVLEKAGALRWIGKMFRQIAAPLFPGIDDDACWSALSINMSANVLGLGNAATPAGIEAARKLAKLGKAGQRGLMTLLIMNSTSLQLIPTTVISLRQSAGSQDPGCIWLPTLLTSGVSMIVGLLLLKLSIKMEKE